MKIASPSFQFFQNSISPSPSLPLRFLNPQPCLCPCRPLTLPLQRSNVSSHRRTFQLQCSLTPIMKGPCKYTTSFHSISYTYMIIWFYPTCGKQFRLKLYPEIYLKNTFCNREVGDQTSQRGVNLQGKCYTKFI